MENSNSAKGPVLKKTVFTIPGETFLRSLPRRLIPSRRFLKRAAVVLSILIAVALLARLGLDIYASRKLNSRLEALEKSGAPIHMYQLMPKPVPDDENAGNLLKAVFLVIGRNTPKNEETLFSYDTYNESELVPLELQKAAREALDKPRIRMAIQLVTEASKLESCDFRLAWEKGSEMELTHLTDIRRISKMLGAKAFFESRDGKHDNAFATCLVGIRTAARLEQEPILISHLVCVASLGISLHSLKIVLRDPDFTEAQYREAIETLAAMDIQTSWKRAMEGERCMLLAVYQRIMAEGDVTYFDMDSGELRRPGPLAKAFGWSIRPWMKLVEAKCIDLMGEDISAPWLDTQTGKRLNVEISRSPFRLFDMLMPCFDKNYSLAAIARRDLACLAMALRIHKGKTGSYPKSLDELVPGALTKLPIDPYSGGPYMYKADGAGFKVYSVGKDRVDQGGTPPNPPGDSEHGDIVWEMPK
jgi:hypothetical protein